MRWRPATRCCGGRSATTRTGGAGRSSGSSPASGTCRTTAGLSGDEVELVAFDVGEGRPAGRGALEVAEPSGAKILEALGLGLEGVADQVKVEAVLDDLRLWYPVEGEARAADGLVAGEQDGVLGGSVSCDLPTKHGTPEPGQFAGGVAVDGDAEEGVAHPQSFLLVRIDHSI